MPHTLNTLNSAVAGEWSPSMDARTDLASYRKAARKLRNMLVLKQGGATRRPGTQFIAKGKLGGNYVLTIPSVSRMQKFQYAPGTTFQLEFCDKGIRFYSNGAQVQAPSPPAWVSGTSYPLGAFVTYGGNTWYAWYAPVINSTGVPSTTPTYWREQTAYEVPAPYSGSNFTAPAYWNADVFVLRTKQINDVVYIVHPNFPVYKLTRYADTNWVMQQVQFLSPALLDQNPTDTTIAAGATSGSGVSLASIAPAWSTGRYYTIGNSVSITIGGVYGIYNCAAIHTSGTFTTDLANGLWTPVTVFQAGHVGSTWQLAYNRPSSQLINGLTGNGTTGPLYIMGTWELVTYGTWEATITVQASYDNGVTWQTITSVFSNANANFNIQGQDIAGGIYQIVITNWVTQTSAIPAMVTLTADNQFVYGLVEITAVTDAYDATCTVVTPLYATGPTQYWSEAAWSGVRGYPQAIAVFQERVWYGASTYQAQRVWATQTDDIENLALLDQSQATYGLAFDLNAPERGPIQWLNAQTDLYAGLAAAEWILTSGSGSAAITPTAILAVEHSAIGSSFQTPGIIIGNAAFYVVRKGSAFQQMLYSVFTNKYMSQDMQLLAQHLTGAGIMQFDFQQQFENQSILWAVCGDGSLISMTYDMQQEVFGWAKHTTGDGVDFGFLSVSVNYGAQGKDDEVWVSVLRQGGIFAGDIYCSIERLWPVDWQVANMGQPQLSEAWYADCAVQITSPSNNVIPLTSIPAVLANPVTGYRTLCASLVRAGENGIVAFNNIPYSNTAGGWVLPNYVPAAGDILVVGLPINWAYQPMRLDVDERAGQTQGITKAISKLYLRLLNSVGGNIMTQEGDIVPLPTYPITANSGFPPPFDDDVPVEVEMDMGSLMQYVTDCQFIVTGSDPLPFTLLSVTIKQDLGGTQ